MAAIAERIKMLRKANQLSQEEFSKMVDVSNSTLKLIESEKGTPSYHMIKAMCNQFNVSASYFYDDNVYELKEYIITKHSGLKHATPIELKAIENAYFKKAYKLKKELLHDKAIGNHNSILDLIYELQTSIDELKDFADKNIALYDPERYSSFVKYIEDDRTLLDINAYKQLILSIIKKIEPYKVDIDLFQGEIEKFMKKVSPIS